MQRSRTMSLLGKLRESAADALWTLSLNGRAQAPCARLTRLLLGWAGMEEVSGMSARELMAKSEWAPQ